MYPGHGSSPLARGTPASQRPRPNRVRFIPARAGNTKIPPRNQSHSSGSSPLARGTPDQGQCNRRWHRFIPARAGNTGERSAPPSARTVHPRSRGEHSSWRKHIQRPSGSSPLARGTPDLPGSVSGVGRFIPARAGNTPWVVTMQRCVDGSSPLARGTPARRPRHHPARRFIPARAGNTSALRPLAPRVPVHPRSRGEHAAVAAEQVLGDGSSPLARGTLPGHAGPRGPLRFIPARAGNTRWPGPVAARGSVHPRSRGEHHRRAGRRGDRCRFIPARAGNTCRRRRARWYSSVHPRSRGEHEADVVGLGGIARFIPARAGNTGGLRRQRARPAVHPRSRGEHHSHADGTLAVSGSSPLARGTPRAGHVVHTMASVHPRSRGEHADIPLTRLRLDGSSPLARGTLLEVHPFVHVRRFIPARAGNTTSRLPPYGDVTVHPRSRGEHPVQPTRYGRVVGSSPLARGTPRCAVSTAIEYRFIPARAGNTGGPWRRCPRCPVHPRSRGEHRWRTWAAGAATGSSPLARGTLS